MRTSAWCGLAIALGGLFGVSATAYADDVCKQEEKFDGRPYVQRAQAAEHAGRLKEAHAEASKVNANACVQGVDQTQVRTLVLRLAGRIGEQEERAGRHAEAARWFLEAERVVDADRAMLKHAQAAPQDAQTFQKAWSYFDRGRPGGRSESHLGQLKKIATANGEAALAAEAKAFAPLRDTFEQLTQARDWLRYADGEQRVVARAVARGDALAKDDAPGPLERALPYYRFAGDTAKEKSLRERAARLGEAAASKGDNALAVRYFELAGQTGRAEALAGAVKAQEKKAEAKRRQAFDKDTKALEKELGL